MLVGDVYGVGDWYVYGEKEVFRRGGGYGGEVVWGWGRMGRSRRSYEGGLMKGYGGGLGG